MENMMSTPDPARVAATWLRDATRPIRIDKAEIREARDTLLLDLRNWAKRKATPGEPIGEHTRQALARTSIMIEDVAGNEIPVMIYVFSRRSRVSTYIIEAGAAKTRSDDRDIILVFLNAKYDSGAFLDRGSAFPDMLLRSLTHEVTHVADSFAPPPTFGGRKRPLTDDEDEFDWTAYYNDPSELRAFMREIVDEVVPRAPKFFDTFGRTKGIEYLLKVSDRWGKMKPHLTDRNRNLILKGVHTALRDEGLL